MGFPGATVGKEPACQFRKTWLLCHIFMWKVGQEGWASTRYKSRENLEQFFQPSAFSPVAVCISPGCLSESSRHLGNSFPRDQSLRCPLVRSSPSPRRMPTSVYQVLDRCHRADEVQHAEPVPRRGRKGRRTVTGDPGTEARRSAFVASRSAPRTCSPGTRRWSMEVSEAVNACSCPFRASG